MINNIDKLIPQKLRDDALFKKLVEILNDMCAEDKARFRDIIDKYRDPTSIDPEGAKVIISEFGFDYITSMLQVLSAEEIGTLTAYMAFISLMKSHRDGLEVIFNLLGYAYEIVEWWEFRNGVDVSYGYDPTFGIHHLQPAQWKFVINLFDSENLENLVTTFPEIPNFVRNYVYPQLVWLELLYDGVFGVYEVTSHGTYDTFVDGKTPIPMSYIVAPMALLQLRNGQMIEDLAPFTALFDNNILLEDGFELLTEDSDYLKLE